MQEANQLRTELTALRTTDTLTGTKKGPVRAPRRPSSASPRLSDGAAPRGSEPRFDFNPNPTAATSPKHSPSKKRASPHGDQKMTCAASGGSGMGGDMPRSISATIFTSKRCAPAGSSAAAGAEAAAFAPARDGALKAVASGPGASPGSPILRKLWHISADCSTGAACQALDPKGAGGRNSGSAHGFATALGDVGELFKPSCRLWNKTGAAGCGDRAPTAGAGERHMRSWRLWLQGAVADDAAAPHSRMKVSGSAKGNVAYIISALMAIATTFGVSATVLITVLLPSTWHVCN